jgi:hypothetical protein
MMMDSPTYKQISAQNLWVDGILYTTYIEACSPPKLVTADPYSVDRLTKPTTAYVSYRFRVFGAMCDTMYYLHTQDKRINYRARLDITRRILTGEFEDDPPSDVESEVTGYYDTFKSL